MVKEKPPIKMNTKPVYDPNKQYTWPSDSRFVLTGAQFGLWLNSVRAKISSKEGMEVRMALEANEIIEKIMISGVETGIITELKE